MVKMKHKKWVILSIIGGVLMILSSVVGRVGFLGTLINLLSGFVGPKTQQVLGVILTIFSYIAASGGIAVIIGALIAGFSSDFIGRLIAGLGIGASLISLIILIATSIYGGATISDLPSILLTTFNNAYGLVGVLIAIIARTKLKD
jgi:hypothetical protein